MDLSLAQTQRNETDRHAARARWERLRRGLAGNAAFFVSLLVVTVFTYFALFPHSLTDFDPTINNLSLRHEPPGFVDDEGEVYWLGTDHMGRDVWSRIVWGARASLTVGYLGLLLGGLFGMTIGLVAGFYGGWFDRLAMRVIDAFLSFPYILIAIVWASLVGTTMFSLVLIVAVRGWIEFARISRGQTMVVRENDYILAVRSIGANGRRILLRHILPNILASALVVAGFQLGRLILLEATLSFLTIGIRPPTPAWGSMLSDARNYITQAWWTVLFPGLAISLIVMAANFLGDSLRDRLDPSLRGR